MTMNATIMQVIMRTCTLTRAAIRTVAVVITSVLVVQWNSTTLHAQGSIPLEFRYLWDIGRGVERPDWQMLGSDAGLGSAGMIWGYEGEIYITDPTHSRILHVTKEGMLLGIIGQLGEGPGEFQKPRALGFDGDTGTLWVFDMGFPMRYSRFDYHNGLHIYRDGFVSRDAQVSINMNLIVQGQDQYWQTGVRQIARSSNLRTHRDRIRLMGIKGDILREFGQPWEIEDSSPWLRLPPSSRNEGLLLELQREKLVWIWMFRPTIEVWTKEGILITERAFNTEPFIDKPAPTRDSRGIVSAVSVFGNAAYDESADIIYVAIKDKERDAIQFLGLDTNTLQERETYYLQKDPELENCPNPMSFLVERIGGTIHFYSFDLSTRSLIVLFPKH